MRTLEREFSILFAGGGTAGHLLPALATEAALQEILTRRPEMRLVVRFLATKEGAELRILSEKGADFYLVPKTDFPRGINIRALSFLPRLLVAIFRTLPVARRSDVVVGFGGYVALPAYIAAFILRKPLIIHEANAVPGLANRLGRVMATRTLTNFPVHSWRNSTAIGLPIRSSIWKIGKMGEKERASEQIHARKELNLDTSKKTILVFGGSLGAAKINSTLESAVDELIYRGYQILHATGVGKESLAERPGYHPVAYIAKMDQAFLAANIVIARSGAGTCAELLATGTPALLIPLDIGNGEQRKNAEELLAQGNVQLIANEELTSVNMLSAIEDLSKRSIVGNSRESSPAQSLAEVILECGGVR
jgi:UDP-N-acetylglucosamine--N-acetylmuramyl-(pentapeptide) pyrophosphoryl-undecaprenol N-acetylglucosamine transferase